ncbi:TonB-dependent receptor [Rubricoccus marinus]|uniref:TonB-dependent receptor n=1 Tax=Rubricoccus marinus TaxID=716817 RepID=UPI0015C612BB|nr:TonB-dependent receptor [Rubricoccus marinus]
MRSLLLLLLLLPSAALAQSVQTIRGSVLDRDTRAPVIGATVLVVDSEPLLGSASDTDGRFAVERVPLGRHTLEVRSLGYESLRLPNVLVSAGQETVLEIALSEAVLAGEEVVVSAARLDGRPRNEMATVSARSFSAEQTSRFAGAVDDPARLAASFAGVAPTGSGIADNAIAIRGNAPKGVLWRLEGVEIPNPNHFAGLSVAGGGGLTLFSGELLADSDVFTGAFPAEYGNALSGVFEMHFRTGNPATREHTLKAGLIGLEVASEGPIQMGAPSTYLVNYRYSTLGLLLPLLPTDAGATYQDLSFKLAFPTRGAGRFELWGIGGLDGQTLVENPDSTTWTSDFWDRTRFDVDLGVGASGLSHHLVLGTRTYLRTTAALTAQRTEWDQQHFSDDLDLQPDLTLKKTTSRASLGATLTHKWSPRHLTTTGVSLQRIGYDLDLRIAPDQQPPLAPVAVGSGTSEWLEAFAQSRLTLASGVTLNAGAHAQHFALTGQTTIEPRVGASWAFARGQEITLGYGLHSQREDLRFYLVRPDGMSEPNRDLGLARAHHLVAGYSRQLSNAVRVQAEAYAQRLFDVPVIADSSFSLLNIRQDWTFAEALVNDGVGENIGIEMTVERSLRGGFYALATGSLYRSRYRGGDGLWRPTRFDQRYAVNALAGHEVRVGRANLLGVNVRVSAVGGERRSPVDVALSRLREEVIYDESRAFEDRSPASWVADLTLTYRVNGRRAAHVWSLQLKNALLAKDSAWDYDLRVRDVVEIREGYPLPVLSYALEL